MRFVGGAWRSCATLLRSLTRTTGNIMGRRGFAACGRRGTFPAMGKYPKDRRGTPQRRTLFANGGLPPVPHYGGRVPAEFCSISGAQNLSGGSKFPPGHWALGLQKFRLVRSRWCAWLYRANAPGANPGWAGLGPAPARKTQPFCIRRRGGSQTRPPGTFGCLRRGDPCGRP